MNTKPKLSFRHKIFIVMLFISAANVVLLLLLGTTLIERFYTHDKLAELRQGAASVGALQGKSDEDILATISEMENRNIMVTLFSVDDSGIYTIYTTRRQQFQRITSGAGPSLDGEAPDSNKNPGIQEIPSLFGNTKALIIPSDIAESIHTLETGKSQTFGEDDSGKGSVLTLVSKLNDNTALVLETPKGYIAQTAGLAVRYNIYLSLGLFVLGSIAMYTLATRLSKPIQHIQQVADKIAHMELSERCEVHTDDEVGMLGGSINNMADKLQENIDQLTAANEVLKSDLDRQEKTDQMRRDFIANVSHDIKTPLTVIISYAEALKDLSQSDKKERAEFCRIILEEGNRMAYMVNQLLGLSQLESGMVKMEKTRFNIGELLELTAKNQRLIAAKKEIGIAVTGDMSIVVHADYPSIQKVVDNLLQNAVKYTPEGGRIELSCHSEAEGCRVRIFNTGAPIAEADLPHLFDSFYRADKSRKRSAADSFGLGLAIVKAVMEKHGQPFGVHNRADGVEFWFGLEQVAGGDIPEK